MNSAWYRILDKPYAEAAKPLPIGERGRRLIVASTEAARAR